jgi:hypothetical protein
VNPDWIAIAIENAERDAHAFPAWSLKQLPAEVEAAAERSRMTDLTRKMLDDPKFGPAARASVRAERER